MSARVLLGDCLDHLRDLPDNSVDSIVTDSPYGLSKPPTPKELQEILRAWMAGLAHDHGKGGFLGKKWDAFVPDPRVWRECLRVAKPRGHLITFAGSRTADLMGISLRLAGWDVRTTINWAYWEGKPAGLNIGKAIDKQRHDRDQIRQVCKWLRSIIDSHPQHTTKTVAQVFGFHSRMVDHWAARDTDSQPAVPTLEQWPRLLEVLGVQPPDDIARLVVHLNQRKGTPGENWEDRAITGEHTSGIRLGHAGAQGGGPGKERRDIPATPEAARWEGWNTTLAPTTEPALLCQKPFPGTFADNVQRWGVGGLNIDACRWGPGAPEWLGPNEDLPSTHSQSKAAADGCHTIGKGWQGMETHQTAGQRLGRWPGNLIYVPKASTTERERGCDGLPVRTGADRTTRDMGVNVLTCPEHGETIRGSVYACGCPRVYESPHTAGVARVREGRRNHGPCVKPVRLLRWLCRLVTPPGGLVVDPFAGTGSCGVAAVLEGFRYLGMELEGPDGEDYHSVAVARVAHAQRYPDSWVNTEPGRVEKVKDPERKERAAKAGQMGLFR